MIYLYLTCNKCQAEERDLVPEIVQVYRHYISYHAERGAVKLFKIHLSKNVLDNGFPYSVPQICLNLHHMTLLHSIVLND